VFKQFAEWYGVPSVAMTDQDKAMKAAIDSAWPGCNHLLCAYHLFCNIKKNITYPVFGGSKNAKRKKGPPHLAEPSDKTEFHRKWWAICKKTDSQSIDTFKDEWEELENLILKKFNNDATSAGFLDAKEHMDTLYNLRHRWACRCSTLHPPPSTLHPKPSIPNPQP
jgi:hypothetical protein